MTTCQLRPTNTGVLSSTVRYGTEDVSIRTVLSLIFMLLVKIIKKFFYLFVKELVIKIVTLWYGTVRLVHRKEDIWVVLLPPTKYGPKSHRNLYTTTIFEKILSKIWLIFSKILKNIRGKSSEGLNLIKRCSSVLFCNY